MTTPDGSVSDVEIDVSKLSDSAEDAFLKNFISDEDPSKKKVSEQKEDDTTTDADETETSEETPEDKEDESKGDDAKTKKKYLEDEETYIKVKVGEEEHEVPVKDLRRLFGQEAALTKKSQAVAAAQQKADNETAKALASLDVLLKRAQQRSQPFRELDFMKVAKELDDESLKVLRNEAQRAFEEETFLQNELGNFMQAVQQQQQQTRTATAKETIKSLSDQASPHYIEGWSQKTYDDLRAFAINEGVDAGLVNNVIEAPIIKLMHMAMQFKKGQSKVVTTKTKKAPTKIVKTSNSPVAVKSDANLKKKADAKLARTGKQDDAVDAFLARMAVEED